MPRIDRCVMSVTFGASRHPRTTRTQPRLSVAPNANRNSGGVDDAGIELQRKAAKTLTTGCERRSFAVLSGSTRGRHMKVWLAAGAAAVAVSVVANAYGYVRSSAGPAASARAHASNGSPEAAKKHRRKPKLTAGASFSLPLAGRCISGRKLTFQLRKLPGVKWRTAVVFVNGKRFRTITGAQLNRPVQLTGLPETHVRPFNHGHHHRRTTRDREADLPPLPGEVSSPWSFGGVGGERFGDGDGDWDRLSGHLLAQLRRGDGRDADRRGCVRLDLQWLVGRRLLRHRHLHRHDEATARHRDLRAYPAAQLTVAQAGSGLGHRDGAPAGIACPAPARTASPRGPP